MAALMWAPLSIMSMKMALHLWPEWLQRVSIHVILNGTIIRTINLYFRRAFPAELSNCVSERMTHIPQAPIAYRNASSDGHAHRQRRRPAGLFQSGSLPQ